MYLGDLVPSQNIEQPLSARSSGTKFIWTDTGPIPAPDAAEAQALRKPTGRPKRSIDASMSVSARPRIAAPTSEQKAKSGSETPYKSGAAFFVHARAIRAVIRYRRGGGRGNRKTSKVRIRIKHIFGARRTTTTALRSGCNRGDLAEC